MSAKSTRAGSSSAVTPGASEAVVRASSVDAKTVKASLVFVNAAANVPSFPGRVVLSSWGVCNFTGRGRQRPYTRSPAARPHCHLGASATSLGEGNEGRTPDPPQQDPSDIKRATTSSSSTSSPRQPSVRDSLPRNTSWVCGHEEEHQLFSSKMFTPSVSLRADHFWNSVGQSPCRVQRPGLPKVRNLVQDNRHRQRHHHQVGY